MIQFRLPQNKNLFISALQAFQPLAGRAESTSEISARRLDLDAPVRKSQLAKTYRYRWIYNTLLN